MPRAGVRERGETVRMRFRDVAREQLPHLYSLARRLVGDRAEDAVQDALTRAYRSFDGLEDPKAAPAWFRTILVNCVRDKARKEARRVDETSLDDIEEYSLYRKIAERDPFPYSDSLHLDFLHSFVTEDVWAVLDRLDDIYRIPLVLVHMEGWPTKEVAERLDAPLGTILSRLHRGRKLFERELWEYADAEGLLRSERRAR